MPGAGVSALGSIARRLVAGGFIRYRSHGAGTWNHHLSESSVTTGTGESMSRENQLSGRVARVMLAATLTAAAGFLVGVPTANAEPARPTGFNPVVADAAAAAMTAETNLS